MRQAKLDSMILSLILTAAFLQGCSSGGAGASDTSTATSNSATSALSVASTTYSVAPGSTAQITATGGTAPYTFAILEASDSSIGVNSGLFTAGSTTGTFDVVVTDRVSSKAYASIVVTTYTGTTTTTNTSASNLSYGANGFSLAPNQSVTFSDGANVIFQSDGNLVSNNSSGSPVWSSGTGGMNCASGCSANFQSDGNLVLYQAGSPYWNSNTGGTGATLVLSETSPYIWITNSSGSAVWAGAAGTMSQVTFSTAQPFQLNANQRIWVTGGFMNMQGDGNLIITGNSGKIFWNLQTGGHTCAAGCNFNWQADGNLVVYEGGVPYYSSNTAGTGANFVFSQTYPYLRIYDSGGNLIWQSY